MHVLLSKCSNEMYIGQTPPTPFSMTFNPPSLPPCVRADSVGVSSSVVRSRWLRDMFEGADKDNSGTLTMKEVLALMHDLNVGVSKKILKRMFKVCSGGLAWNQDTLCGPVGVS